MQVTNRNNHVRRWQVVGATLAAVLLFANAFADADHRSVSTLDSVTVVGVSAVPGADIPPDQLAGNIQSTSSDALALRQAFDITEQLTRSMGSVFSNDAQGNPLQRDVQVRGFVASPLLGLSQGISVYQDGVRVNEPFGDTVNWALIPDNAIAEVDLIAGSNPMFGLNTLGGALVLHTKNGFTHAGFAGEVSYGSAQQLTTEASFGAAKHDTAYFIAASRSQENGWRDYSPTRATQVFADTRRRSASGETSLSLTYANTDLIGNGPAPESLLAIDRKAIFTRPDRTQNTMWLISAGATLQSNATDKLVSRVYERHSNVATLNGDESDFAECALLAGIVCLPGEDQAALDQSGNPIAFTPRVDGATINRSNTKQVGRGIALQWVQSQGNNHSVLGVSMDRGESRFESNTELGALDDTRQAIGSDSFAEAVAVALTAHAINYSAFFSNTWSTPRTAVTLAGRYYRQTIELRDQLGTDLNGDHEFSRFNPSLGWTAKLGTSATFYASYAHASRAPSPVELTCANPNDPCRLPNAFLSDPPLRQVIAETIEAGLRGTGNKNRWHVGAFRTDNRNDIIFVSAGAFTNQGYFTNVDATRRQGVELVFAGALTTKLNWFLNYTWLAATFGGDLQIASTHNPAAINGVINVQRGDHLPGVPQHLAKMGFDYTLARWSMALDTHYAGSQFARGDEGNDLRPLPAYFTVNAQMGFALGDRGIVSVGVRNALNREYATFATLGNANEVLGTSFGNERFTTPAAPRSVWLALRAKL